ncbi:TetR/AcrR family transcriptional regulator [Paraburkholderia sp. GAS32]|uniref:TetR/AcrR family transcriptional regulator n=1 Tax=Paraburkholderia sp. GAS32 TaxID=3035129 RepID=UPI003D20AFB5
MRKSRIETAETRKRIVATASRVFLTNGLAATGIADIMVAAGLTQGGFFRHFRSKGQLVAEANGAAFGQLMDMFERVIAGKPPREALDTIVSIYLHQLQGKDPVYLCPLANLGSELRHSDEQVKATTVDGYERLVRLIAQQTQQLGIAGHADVANAIVSTLVGAVTLSRLAPDPGTEETILLNAQNVVRVLLQCSPQANVPTRKRRSLQAESA